MRSPRRSARRSLRRAGGGEGVDGRREGDDDAAVVREGGAEVALHVGGEGVGVDDDQGAAGGGREGGAVGVAPVGEVVLGGAGAVDDGEGTGGAGGGVVGEGGPGHGVDAGGAEERDGETALAEPLELLDGGPGGGAVGGDAGRALQHAGEGHHPSGVAVARRFELLHLVGEPGEVGAAAQLADARAGQRGRDADHRAEPVRERPQRPHLFEGRGPLGAAEGDGEERHGLDLVAHHGHRGDAVLLHPGHDGAQLGVAHLDGARHLEAEDALGLPVGDGGEGRGDLGLLHVSVARAVDGDPLRRGQAEERGAGEEDAALATSDGRPERAQRRFQRGVGVGAHGGGGGGVERAEPARSLGGEAPGQERRPEAGHRRRHARREHRRGRAAGGGLRDVHRAERDRRRQRRDGERHPQRRGRARSARGRRRWW